MRVDSNDMSLEDIYNAFNVPWKRKTYGNYNKMWHKIKPHLPKVVYEKVYCIPLSIS